MENSDKKLIQWKSWTKTLLIMNGELIQENLELMEELDKLKKELESIKFRDKKREEYLKNGRVKKSDDKEAND